MEFKTFSYIYIYIYIDTHTHTLANIIKNSSLIHWEAVIYIIARLHTTAWINMYNGEENKKLMQSCCF
jgi:hypothetical protein